MNQKHRDEQTLADQLVSLLDSQGNQDMTNEEQKHFELGNLIRQAAGCELPEPNPELREMLISELDRIEQDDIAVTTKASAASPTFAISSRESRLRWLAAATLFLVAGGATFMLVANDFYRSERRRGRAVTADLKGMISPGAMDALDVEPSFYEVLDDQGTVRGHSISSDSNEEWKGTLDNLTAAVKSKHNDLYVKDNEEDRIAELEKIVPNLIRRVNPSGSKEIMIRPLGDGAIEVDHPSDRHEVIETDAVNAVVSVPEAGTVLLGGIKRSTEKQLANQQAKSEQLGTLESKTPAFRAPTHGEEGRGSEFLSGGEVPGKIAANSSQPFGDFDSIQQDRSRQLSPSYSGPEPSSNPINSSTDKYAFELDTKNQIGGNGVRAEGISGSYFSDVPAPVQLGQGMGGGMGPGGGLGMGGQGMGGQGMGGQGMGGGGGMGPGGRMGMGGGGGMGPGGRMGMGGGGMGGRGFGEDNEAKLGGMMSNMIGKRGYYREIWERSSGEQYTPIHENKFVAAVGGEAISTFSIDVDTASYANVRRFVTGGQLPPPDSVRIEELVNYFNYDYPQPKADRPFSVSMELATCPWDQSHKLLRVGLKGKDVHINERPPTNVVFLLDVSGSMNSEDKLPLLKRGFQMMVDKLGENDRVSIVTYAGNAGVVLEPTTGEQKKTINEAIERLTSGGSTHGSAGIKLAYELAQKNFIQGGVNKVILATDGDLNVGVTDDNSLVKLITEKASEGVFLTVLGFGTGNLKDGKMEKLADNGNGMYAYIDSIREAHKVLVEQMSGSLVTIAKDVKIQIEFNPAEVRGYRLLGYENRMLKTQDFDNDKKDAGEIGAGHTVTAIYELVTVDKMTESDKVLAPKGLKYQSSEQPGTSEVASKTKANLSDAASTGELCTLALRYKQPDENTSKRIEFTIKNDEKSFLSASDDFRFASSVAAFGMILRGSKYAGQADPAMVQEIAVGAIGNDRSGYRAEFVDMVRRVNEICR